MDAEVFPPPPLVHGPNEGKIGKDNQQGNVQPDAMLIDQTRHPPL
jgi:hypothetical protein